MTEEHRRLNTEGELKQAAILGIPPTTSPTVLEQQHSFRLTCKKSCAEMSSAVFCWSYSQHCEGLYLGPTFPGPLELACFECRMRPLTVLSVWQFIVFCLSTRRSSPFLDTVVHAAAAVYAFAAFGSYHVHADRAARRLDLR